MTEASPRGRPDHLLALMASLMNLALVVGQLETKYLNWIFEVDRGAYGHLPELVIAA